MIGSDALAMAALEEIRSGMIVGLGTGRAAARAIVALARRVSDEQLDVVCVATSHASEALGREVGLIVEPLASLGHVDHLVDGADEVDPWLRMLKGRGGAMTREKVVAHAARRRVYLVQKRKLVAHLGETAPLPVEVTRSDLPSVRRAIGDLGLDATAREADPGRRVAGTGEVRYYLTDGGNPVLDARLPASVDLSRLAAALDAMPGVVGHGLFLNEADLVLVEGEQGQVSRCFRGGPGLASGPT